MAWEARLGLKLSVPHWGQTLVFGLNGLGSPSGIETKKDDVSEQYLLGG